jgi:hypothetical protein
VLLGVRDGDPPGEGELDRVHVDLRHEGEAVLVREGLRDLPLVRDVRGHDDFGERLVALLRRLEQRVQPLGGHDAAPHEDFSEVFALAHRHFCVRSCHSTRSTLGTPGSLGRVGGLAPPVLAGGGAAGVSSPPPPPAELARPPSWGTGMGSLGSCVRGPLGFDSSRRRCFSSSERMDLADRPPRGRSTGQNRAGAPTRDRPLKTRVTIDELLTLLHLALEDGAEIVLVADDVRESG